jgi:ABC-type antimicrobial peptide transport system permease subunit
MLSSSFAGLALLLAAIGLYAVIAYGVAQRLRELGIRIALGAQRRQVRWLVLSRVLRMGLVGGAIGLTLAFAFGRLGRGLLFGVAGYEAPIAGLAALVVLTVALAAGVLPARRATLVDPVAALRAE